MLIRTIWENDDGPWMVAAVDDATIEAHNGLPDFYTKELTDNRRELVIEIPDSAVRKLFVVSTVKATVKTSTDERPQRPCAITFIINGEDIVVKVDSTASLGGAAEQALAQSHNNRPSFFVWDVWDIRDDAGVLIDGHRTIADYGFSSGSRVFLTRKVGAGG